MISEVFNEDCMIGMARYADKHFDLAIVDPPYGIGVNHNMGRRKGVGASSYKPAVWDNQPPPRRYFEELFRISKNQIIWGANHFITSIGLNSSCWIVWDKGFSEDLSFAQIELAWTSFSSTCKMYEKPPNQEKRIHPTQKPVNLYKWLISRYLNGGRVILDTHMGSQSSRIAAHEMNCHYIGFEIDKDHFDDGNKRFAQRVAQNCLFDDPDLYTTGE